MWFIVIAILTGILFLSQWGLGVLKYLFSDTEFLKSVILEIYTDNNFINIHPPSITVR